MAEGIKTWIVDTSHSVVEGVRNLGRESTPATETNTAEAGMPPELAEAVQDMLAKNTSTGTNRLRLFAEEPTEDEQEFKDDMRTGQYLAVGMTAFFSLIVLYPTAKDMWRRHSDAQQEKQMNRMLADPHIMALRRSLSSHLSNDALDRVLRDAAPRILYGIKAGLEPDYAVRRALPSAIISEWNRLPRFSDPMEIAESRRSRMLELNRDVEDGKMRINDMPSHFESFLAEEMEAFERKRGRKPHVVDISERFDVSAAQLDDIGRSDVVRAMEKADIIVVDTNNPLQRELLCEVHNVTDIKVISTQSGPLHDQLWKADPDLARRVVTPTLKDDPVSRAVERSRNVGEGLLVAAESDVVRRTAAMTIDPLSSEVRAAAERARKVGEGIAGRERPGEKERDRKAGERERVKVKPRGK